MKKYWIVLSLLLLTGMVTSCYDDSSLQERIDRLEQAMAQNVEQQKSDLMASVAALTNSFNTQLQAWSEKLTAESENADEALQLQINDLKKDMKDLQDFTEDLKEYIDYQTAALIIRMQGYTSKEEFEERLKSVQDGLDDLANEVMEQLAGIQARFDDISARMAALVPTLDILFAEGDTIRYIVGVEAVNVGYTLTGADDKTRVECLADAGWGAEVIPASAMAGTIRVTPPAEGGKGKVLVFVGSTTNTVMRVLAFEEDVLSDEQLYTFVGTWPQSAKTPGAKLCDGELSKLMGKISGNTYYAQNHMGSAFQRDHRATDDEKAWLADYTAKPSTMDGFNRWGARRITLYPYGRPYPADCNQHSIGDCNTISTLATMAYLYPRFIQSIITQVSDKEFQVKMFDPDGNRIIVGVDNQILLTNDSYIAQVTGKSNRLTWATILEKAIMKWLTVYRPGAQLGGFGAEGMTPLFTGDGRSFAISPGRCTAAELQQFVTVCINHGLIVNGGFNKQGLKLGNRETITAHGHSFFLANDPEALFAVRNPWGGDPDDHVFQVYDADHAPSGFDGTVPSTIDLRIISPGIASLYYDGPATPYVVP